MQNYREAGQTLLNILKDVKAELGLRAGLELVCAVGGTDSDSQRVAAGALDKFLNVLGSGIRAVLMGNLNLVLYSGEGTELCLNDDAVVMCIFNNLLGQSNILLEGLGGSVYHNGGKSAVNAGLAQLKAVAVVKMQCDGKPGLDDRGLDQLHKVSMICIFTCALGDLKNKRSVELCGGFGYPLHDFHIIDVESTDGIAPVICFLEHLSSSYQWHNFSYLLLDLLILYKKHIYKSALILYPQKSL